ncbi:non-ribosomal peptide synthetase [Brevibacillus borstelensis]|uniref:non-ribosomal peptide synthetase n=1 Tax=Brevibacillus borstelensis TaxID=45462 RepID=UPI002E1F4F97|nr:non-ribosomal peptide synthetase [Brevibacillus borstelensis]MED1744792.1 amino acid adenylation domain-containing protein [Brevibacillus borstelensis]MED1876332.1 amino acid adenylation domain-containing protein [Brevibacillus borstelensis]
MYTSGSTGRPKGVMVEHRNLMHYVSSIIPALKLEEGMNFATVSTLAADLGNTSIFPSLCLGGTLHILSMERITDSHALAEYLSRNPVDCLKIVPSHLSALLGTNPEMVLPKKRLVFGGEALHWDLVDLIQNSSPELLIFNHYGPTETTVGVMTYHIEKGKERHGVTVPLGTPIQNVETYVLDENLQMVPDGEPGELYIGGAGVARGYLFNEELTQERFIQNPFSNDPFDRLYKTGDRVRKLPDHTLEFLGRLDFQIKIRGFRIEPVEVEAVLVQHPYVREAAVLAHTNPNDEVQLVAYLVGDSNDLKSLSEIRGYLKENLPEYMIPTSFVWLDSMPLTVNGKIDRQALPEPDFSAVPILDIYEAPRTPIEVKLANIWGEVLNLSQIGRDHDFFELGGHSLLLARIASRIRDTFHVELPVRAFFDFPTVAGMAEWIENMLQKNQEKTDSTIVSVTREKNTPQSFAQKRMWLLNQFTEGTAAYNIHLPLRITGFLNIEVVEKSLQEIVNRHEILRTVFAEEKGDLVQVVLNDQKVSLHIIDLSNEPEEEREELLNRYLIQEAQYNFSLMEGPLFRTVLYKLSSNEFVLMFIMHHIISDGWSWNVLMKEWIQYYDHFLNGTPLSLQKLPIQYTDYSIWQHRWMQSEWKNDQLNYWKEKLSGTLPVLNLPTDRPRPSIQSYRGSVRKMKIPTEICQGLNELSQSRGSTLYMTLLAAFNALLYRYSAQEDIIIGTPVANRNRTEIEHLIGMFVNTLALRNDLSGNPTFLELLSRVRETVIQAFENQDIPFEKIVEELLQDRHLSYSPIFQVMFAYENSRMKHSEMPQCSIRRIDLHNGTAMFDLTMTIIDEGQELLAELEYNTDLFYEDTICRMLNHYIVLLKGVVEDPSQRLLSLPLLTENERQTMLVEWNNTYREVPKNKGVHHLFEEQVNKSPDSTAVVIGEVRVTYHELNERANQLAHYLRKIGVGSKCFVGVSFDKSPELIITLLGVLKAGAAYVPIDPSLPKERMLYMVEDAEISLLITHGYYEHLFTDLSVKVLPIDKYWEDISRESRENLDCVIEVEHTAYLIYTSGSTGKPKGVLVPHQSLVNHNLSIIREFCLTIEDKVLQFASISFDVSAEEIFPTLLSGGALVLSNVRIPTYLELLTLIEKEQLTVLNLPTAYWSDWVNSMFISESRVPSCVRLMVVGGEKVSLERYKMWKKISGNGVVFKHAYGLTETTITSTIFTLEEEVEEKLTVIPIGRPIANTKLYVLDQAMNPVPIGMPGELYIAGDCLATGYHRKHELTESRFVPDPFESKPGAKMYKTGDLVRYLPDGNVDFLGRLDHQVKIRGFRVELGEIEEILSQYPSVQKAIVTVQEVDGIKNLVAYVLVGDTNQPLNETLRNYMKEKVPEYMVPSFFVKIDKIPLNSSGKVDMSQLPSVKLDEIDREADRISPRNELEFKISEIWSEVLGLNQEAISIYDNFFAIGGHSLRAVQVISRIRERFGIEMSLVDLFRSPTVADLASVLQGGKMNENKSTLSTVQNQKWLGEALASPSQEGLWFFQQLQPSSTAYHMSSILKFYGNLNRRALEHSLSEIVRRHDILRTTFVNKEERLIQVIASPDLFSVNFIDLQDVTEKERADIAKQKVTQLGFEPFDLENGPLFRATLLQLSKEEYWLSLNAHHIIFDGWSWGILYKEFETLYQSFVSGNSSPLSDLKIQYSDYTLWQRDLLQSEGELHLEYWRKQLDGAPAFVDLPADYPRPAVQTFRGARYKFKLSSHLSKTLREMSKREGTTLYMTLLAGFKALVARLTGEEDIVVGSPVANRPQVEMEKLIGFFVNSLVLRTRVDRNLSFSELLQHVKETTINAFEHQAVPFELLVKELKVDRDLSRNPFFQIYFNMLNVPPIRFQIGDLNIEQIEQTEVVSKFDLTLYVDDSGEEICFDLVYNRDLFHPNRMEEFSNQLVVLYEQVAENAEIKLHALSLVTEQTRKILPNPLAPLPVQDFDMVHSRLAKIAELYPERIAIQDSLGSWTYHELHQKSNQLANYLIAQGVKTGDVIAVYAVRNAALVLALMGIYKSGAAFVLLDSSYPTQRLVDMVRAANIVGLIYINEAGNMAEPLEDLFKLGFRVTLTAKKDEINDEPFSKCSYNDPGIPIGLDDTAYIAFTSGTTGKPKGIVGTHRPIVHFLDWHTKTFMLTEKDRISMLSGLAHDPLLRDVFTPFYVGGVLCIPDQRLMESSANLCDWMKRAGITVAHLTPAMGQLMLTAAQPGDLTKLRYAFFSGDVLTKEDTKKFCIVAPQVTCVNFYGATETPQAMGFGVDLGYDEQDIHASTRLKTRIPLDRGIDGVDILILTVTNQLAGIGELGEIHIRTPYLSKGYLHDQRHTQSKFIPNPYTGKLDDLMYKTGDLGRYLPDGRIEILGRVDRQVKIRGFRIELDEIEAVISRHPDVLDTVVVVKEMSEDNKLLIAYVVAPDVEDLESAMRDHLRAYLPAYMIPSIFIALEALPLTPNGKIDWKRLPSFDTIQANYVSVASEPLTPTEECLVEVWKEVLGITDVSKSINFFTLGGHSLKAMKVLSRLRELFGIEVPLRAFFENPTIEHLAQVIDQMKAERTDSNEISEIMEELIQLSSFDEESLEELLDYLKNYEDEE